MLIRAFVLLVTTAVIVVGTSAPSQAVPIVTSATLTYHLDAGNGTTNTGNGTAITGWQELTTNTATNIQGTPTWQATGLNGLPSVRFDGGPSGGDLVFSNNAPINNVTAQTIFVVATMVADAHILSDLIANSSGLEAIRQTTTETAAYFIGNSGDFHSGGSFFVNGDAQFTIPGGFGVAHIVESVSPTAVNINSLRIGNNASNRLWAGDVSEVLVYNGLLSAADRTAVGGYLQTKYSINASYVPEPASVCLAVCGLLGLMFVGWRRNKRKAK